MTNKSSEKELKEMGRLNDLGWQEKSEGKSRRFEKEDEISFPSENYRDAYPDLDDFWIQHRANRIHRILMSRRIEVLWEVGAGNGNVSKVLRSKGVGVICIEPLYTGVDSLLRSGAIALHGTLESLNLPDGSIRAIGIFDVIEHLEDPSTVLQEIFRVLEPGGELICTVPAYQFLFSDFDRSIGHFRRYTRKTLSALLIQNNYKLVHKENIFFSLILPAFVLRKFFTTQRSDNCATETKQIDRFQVPLRSLLRQFLLIFFKAESFLKLPFGLSLLYCVTKPPLSK